MGDVVQWLRLGGHVLGSMVPRATIAWNQAAKFDLAQSRCLSSLGLAR
jgi:hypothetical protein